MIWTVTDIAIFGAVIATIEAVCFMVAWFTARKTMMQGFRMGRLSQDKSDVILANKKSTKNEIVRLGDEYDPFNEAMIDPAAQNIGTVEGEKQ